MGEIRRAIGREEDERRDQDLFASTFVMAALVFDRGLGCQYCLHPVASKPKFRRVGILAERLAAGSLGDLVYENKPCPTS